MGDVGGLCEACSDVCSLKCVIPVAVVVIILCLFVNPEYPEVSVEQFYVSAFNKTASNATSSTISFNIKLQNRNSAIGVYYDSPINVTFSFIPRETANRIIWQYSVPKFYQGNAQSRRLRDVITPLGAPDTPVFNQTVVAEHSSVLPSGAIATGLESVVYFRVEITTKVRLKLAGKHRRQFALSAKVPIGATTGEKFGYGAIRANAASAIGWGGTQSAVMVVLLTAINFIFM
ncbi:putative protein NDR1 [Helianthus debilis subsp. tardiflorus]